MSSGRPFSVIAYRPPIDSLSTPGDAKTPRAAGRNAMPPRAFGVAERIDHCLLPLPFGTVTATGIATVIPTDPTPTGDENSLASDYFRHYRSALPADKVQEGLVL